MIVSSAHSNCRHIPDLHISFFQSDADELRRQRHTITRSIAYRNNIECGARPILSINIYFAHERIAQKRSAKKWESGEMTTEKLGNVVHIHIFNSQLDSHSFVLWMPFLLIFVSIFQVCHCAMILQHIKCWHIRTVSLLFCFQGLRVWMLWDSKSIEQVETETKTHKKLMTSSSNHCFIPLLPPPDPPVSFMESLVYSDTKRLQLFFRAAISH